MLKGGGIGLAANGLNNLTEGNNFFQGGFDAFAFGALGGGFAHGIGLSAQAMSTAGASSLQVGAMQVVSHGLAGGLTNSLQGGSFGSGFLSGGVSSGVGSLTQSLGDPTQLISGSLAGGFGSLAVGGSFIDGVKQGAITVGLNHLEHELFCCSTSGTENDIEYRNQQELTIWDWLEVGGWLFDIGTVPSGEGLAFSLSLRSARMTQWGWKGTKAWRKVVQQVKAGGTITRLNGKIATKGEAIDLIEKLEE